VEHVDPRPRFFLEDAEASVPRLVPEDERHAAAVLRLAAGDRLLGLDGTGGVHPLRVRAAARGRLELERDGPVERAPAPGAAGSPLPWIEVAAPLPKGDRAAAMLDRLTQLGVAAYRPLACARNQGFPRESAEHRLDGLRRACREACKQSGRAWLPRIHGTARPEALRELLAGARSVLLSPGASATLLEWTAGVAAGPLAVLAGPEGGFDERELALLAFAEPAVLGPHVLRIETAVEAAAATVAQAFYARRLRPT
jgi:16S rRNA (uracil1498-N3)-methyltransferase